MTLMKDIEEMQAKMRKEERCHVLTVYSRGWDLIQRDILEFVTVLVSFGE